MSLPEDDEWCYPGVACDFDDHPVWARRGGGEDDPYDHAGDGDTGEPDPYDPYGDEGPGYGDDDDVPDYGEPSNPDYPYQPDPLPAPQPADGGFASVAARELEALAEASHLRALNSLNRAYAMLDRYLGGRISDFDRATVDASMALYFPGATRETIRTIRDTIGRASAFLAGARFMGISTPADLPRITDPFARDAAEAYLMLGDVWLATDQPTNTIFVFPYFRIHFPSAADRASGLTHEAFHGVPEPGAPLHGTWRIDHGLHDGGALDNAYNYQGLVADLAGLPITDVMHDEIDRWMSYPHPPSP